MRVRKLLYVPATFNFSKPVQMNTTNDVAAAAGILFVNRYPNPTHYLAGYQPKRGGITGIGGKKEAGDGSAYHTAIREMLEELLGIHDARWHQYVLRILQERYKPCCTMTSAGYTTYVLTFKDMLAIMYDVKHEFSKYNCIFSTIYTRNLPETLEDVLFNRKPSPSDEVKELAILPLRCPIVVLDELNEDTLLLCYSEEGCS
jgi:hypothetical protein